MAYVYLPHYGDPYHIPRRDVLHFPVEPYFTPYVIPRTFPREETPVPAWLLRQILDKHKRVQSAPSAALAHLHPTVSMAQIAGYAALFAIITGTLLRPPALGSSPGTINSCNRRQRPPSTVSMAQRANGTRAFAALRAVHRPATTPVVNGFKSSNYEPQIWPPTGHKKKGRLTSTSTKLNEFGGDDVNSIAAAQEERQRLVLSLGSNCLRLNPVSEVASSILLDRILSKVLARSNEVWKVCMKHRNFSDRTKYELYVMN